MGLGDGYAEVLSEGCQLVPGFGVVNASSGYDDGVYWQLSKVGLPPRFSERPAAAVRSAKCAFQRS